MVSDMNIFVWKLSKIAAKKKVFFCWFCGPVSVRRLYNDMRRLYWDMRRLYNNMRRLYWDIRRLYNDMRRLYWDMRRLYMMRVLGYSWSTLLWPRCYYPHRLRDALSPVCKIFLFVFLYHSNLYFSKSVCFIFVILKFVFLYSCYFFFRSENCICHGIEMEAWIWQRLMVWTWTHGIESGFWYRHGLMV